MNSTKKEWNQPNLVRYTRDNVDILGGAIPSLEASGGSKNASA